MATRDVERMAPGALRWLTWGERAMAAAVFGDALDAARVRVLAWPGRWPDRAFVPGRAFGRALVVYPRAGALADFSRSAPTSQAVFVHELTHVWQAQSGRFLPWAKLLAGEGPRAYRYDVATPFARLNIEQQASAVEDAFRLRRGLPAPAMTATYAAALPFPVGRA